MSRRRTTEGLHGTRVLVVEDDGILAIELEAILREAGAEIAGPCRSVADALAMIARTRDIAAAVLDVRLGRDTIAPVARQLACQGTPFLFYTGQISQDPTLAEWPNCRIIAKPADARAIVLAISELVASAENQGRVRNLGATPGLS